MLCLHHTVGREKVWTNWNNFFKLEPGTLIDCTAGFGGHSLEWVMSQQRHNIQNILIDIDKSCLEYMKQYYDLKSTQYNIILINENWKNIDQILTKHPFHGERVGFILDFGLNNQQEKSNFFSYSKHKNIPFDLRFMFTNEFKPAFLLIKQMNKYKFVKIFKEHTNITTKNLLKIYNYFYYSKNIVLHNQVYRLFKKLFLNNYDSFIRKFYYIMFNLVNQTGKNIKIFFKHINSINKKIMLQILCFSSLEKDLIITHCNKYNFKNIEKTTILFKNNKKNILLTIKI